MCQYSMNHLKMSLPSLNFGLNRNDKQSQLANHCRLAFSLINFTGPRLIPTPESAESGCPCIRRRETTVEPFKSDTPTAEIRHSFRWSDSWGCKRGDRLICQPPRRLT